MNIRTCGLFSNIAPLYTKPLWRELNADEEIRYYFYTDPKGFAGIKVIDPFESKKSEGDSGFNWYFLRNIYFNDILIYQSRILIYCLKTNYDAYIFNGEAQCISTWLAVFACKLKGKPVIFWGHGLYGNERYFIRIIRKLFYKLADSHLIYGERSKHLMIREGFAANTIFTVYNSLDFDLHKTLFNRIDANELNDLKKKFFPNSFNSPGVIFIGRLTPEKKLSYLLNALAKLKSVGKVINCLIVGDGKEAEKLNTEATNLNIGDNTYFYGSCYDEEMNSRMIMMSDCCVSPGNVGLTAIHCLSLGTPVITHNNSSNQGPEAESIIENKTGMFFEEDDIDDLASKIHLLIFTIRKHNIESNCIDEISKHWNPKYQASVFKNAVINSITKQIN